MSGIGRAQVRVEDAHHLLGRDAVGGEARDERSGAGTDVDVEFVDRVIDGQEVERTQGADLVNAAREAASAQDERRLGGGPLTRRLALRARLCFARRVELDYLAHCP